MQYLDDTEFKFYAYLFIYEHYSYMNLLILGNKNNKESILEQAARNNLEYLDKAVIICDKIMEINLDKNKEFISLFKSYIYRNFYVTYKYLNDSKNMEKYAKLSFDERGMLLHYYDYSVIDSKLLDNFKMEYFIALSEYLPYAEAVFEKEFLLQQLEEYIDLNHNFVKNKNYYLDKMSETYAEYKDD